MKFEIERRANLSYAEFAQKYLFGNKPVVMTDAIRRWKALSRWTPEFFKTEFGDMKFTIDDNKKGKAEYKGNGTVEFTIARFIDRVLASTDEDPAPYFRNRILHETFPTLKQDVEPLPDHFFPNWLPESYLKKSIQSAFQSGSQDGDLHWRQRRCFPSAALRRAGFACVPHADLRKEEIHSLCPGAGAIHVPKSRPDQRFAHQGYRMPGLESIPTFCESGADDVHP